MIKGKFNQFVKKEIMKHISFKCNRCTGMLSGLAMFRFKKLIYFLLLYVRKKREPGSHGIGCTQFANLNSEQYFLSSINFFLSETVSYLKLFENFVPSCVHYSLLNCLSCKLGDFKL